MIYTVTLNPSLDYIVAVDDFKLGMTNRTTSEMILPGGKGINVSIILKNLDMESTALGFTAGFSGAEIIRRLDEMGIKNEFIQVEEGVSRINLKLQSIEGTEINGQGPVISEGKVEFFMEQLQNLKQGDVLFLSGSIPSSIPDDIYRRIMEMLKERGIQIVVDATKTLLLNVLSCHPFLIKPNHHELGDIFGVSLKERKDIIPYAKELQKMGAQNVLVSMAGKGAVLLDENGEIYESEAPKGKLVNAVGAGDSMVAAFMAGYLEKNDYRHAFYMGVAAGSASAFSENLATKKEINDLYKLLKDTESVQ